jgi:hypothetical protein
MSVLLGELREASIWYKTPEQREQAKDYIREAFRYDEQELGVKYGHVEFKDADLSKDRAPAPPEPGAKLLVGEAPVIGLEPTRGERFVLDLDMKDLNMLRKVTQDAWTRGGLEPLPLDELDKVIAKTAPDVMDKMLQWGHANGIDNTH